MVSDPGVPRGLHGPVLFGSDGRLRYWAAVDSFLIDGGCAPSTADARLSHIERLYDYADGLSPRDGLDAVLARQDLGRVHDVLHGFFARLRNEAVRTHCPSERAWLDARRFASSTCDRLARSDGPGHLQRVQDVLDGLHRLDHHLAVGRSRRPKQPRGLPASVLEDLYEIVAPDSRRNPFRNEALRWRNYVIVLLLLHQALRRGELLQLAVDAVKDGFDRRLGRSRFWLNVCVNPHERHDPRGAKAALKNDLATRQIPISRPIADAIEAYVVNFRGKQRWSYLLCSQERRPLSLRALNKLFAILSRKLSAGAQRELWTLGRPVRVSPHDLRHTAAAVRLGQLVGEDHARLPAAIEQLRPFFGWSRDSEMPRLYARTYFQAQVATVWKDDFDARVEFLRRLR